MNEQEKIEMFESMIGPFVHTMRLKFLINEHLCSSENYYHFIESLKQTDVLYIYEATQELVDNKKFIDFMKHTQSGDLNIKTQIIVQPDGKIEIPDELKENSHKHDVNTLDQVLRDALADYIPPSKK